jgi:hypothetical protein
MIHRRVKGVNVVESRYELYLETEVVFVSPAEAARKRCDECF